MGRGKMKMELISNERSRMITYHKRKKGLCKKAQEFHILCNVDACIIIFGPKLRYHAVDVETWPKDSAEVRRIINRFRDNRTERKKTQDLSDFFIGRKKKIDDEIAKLRKTNLEKKFPVWDNRLNMFSADQLRMLCNVLEMRLEVAKTRIMEKRGFLASKSNLMPSNITNALFQKNVDFQQALQLMKPLDQMQIPSYYPPDHQLLQQMVPLNMNYVNDPMLLMMMNGEENSKIHYPAHVNGHVCYNEQPSEVVGNWFLSNPVQQPPITYYGHTTQAMVNYRQGSLVQNGSMQMGFPQFSDLYDMNGKEMNKRDRL